MHDSSQQHGSFAGQALLVALLVALGLLLWQLAMVPLLVFAGVLLGVLLRHLAARLARIAPIPTSAALVAVVLLIGAVIGLGGTLFGARIAAELGELFEQLPTAVTELLDALEETALGAYLLEWSNELEAADLVEGGLPGQIAGVATGVLGAAINVVVAIAIGFYLAADPDPYRRGVLRLVPPRRRARAGEVLDALDEALWRWLLGQFVAMLFVGVATTVGLLLLGMPMAFALGLLAGVLEFVPVIGPIVAAVPAMLVAFTQDGWTPLHVLLLYVIIQQVESYLVVPLIQKRAVAMPPVLTLIAIVVFGLLFGLGGMILAAPLMLVLMLTVDMLYVEDVLEAPSTAGSAGTSNHAAQVADD